MKTVFVSMLALACLIMTISADDEKEIKDKEKEIKKLKKRVHELKEWIDELNGHVCQNGATETAMCDEEDSFTKSFRCMTSPLIVKHERMEYEEKTETRPIVAVGASGLRYLCGVDFELDAEGINNVAFLLECKSNDFFSPGMIRSEYYSCPEALNFKPKYEMDD